MSDDKAVELQEAGRTKVGIGRALELLTVGYFKDFCPSIPIWYGKIWEDHFASQQRGDITYCSHGVVKVYIPLFADIPIFLLVSMRQIELLETQRIADNDTVFLIGGTLYPCY